MFIVLFLLLLYGAFGSVKKYREGLSRVVLLEAEVKGLEAENRRLEEEKAQRETDNFLEKEARDKLKMVKEGERLVVLPETLPVLGAETGATPRAVLPVWRQWLELFFGKKE